MSEPGTPASFVVMLNTLRGLGFDVIPKVARLQKRNLLARTLLMIN